MTTLFFYDHEGPKMQFGLGLLHVVDAVNTSRIISAPVVIIISTVFKVIW